MTQKEYLITFLTKIKSARKPAEVFLLLLNQGNLHDKNISSLIKIIRRIIQENKLETIKENLLFLKKLEEKESQESDEFLDSLLINAYDGK